MSTRPAFAVMIPTYNGGALLRESIESCACAGLRGDQYEILVVDNCSTDGSIDSLPAVDAVGARIRIFSAPSNCGRVANWNRAVEIAEAEGFQFGSFLFVGDTWLADGPLPAMLRRMIESNALLGLGAVQITGERKDPLHVWQRLSVRSGDTVSAVDLVRRAVELGHLPFAPIQANVYRLATGRPLRFDPAVPLSTDIEGTIDFLNGRRDAVVVTTVPFMSWRIHSRRFLAGRDPEETMREESTLLQRVSAATSIPVNWSSANAKYLVSGLFGVAANISWRNRVAHLPRLFRFIASRPGGVSVRAIISLVMKKLVWKESYVSFG